MIWPVRGSPDSLLTKATEVIDIWELRFRYQNCVPVPAWKPLVSRLFLRAGHHPPVALGGRLSWRSSRLWSRSGCARIPTSRGSKSCGASDSLIMAAAKARYTNSW